jgi:hypothetical protein
MGGRPTTARGKLGELQGQLTAVVQQMAVACRGREIAKRAKMN